MSTDNKKKSKGFSNEEKAAMRERARELSGRLDGESAVLASIAKMPEPDRSLAKRLHEIIKANASTLSPKTWYGMPAYANKDGKVVCFFQNASKFKYRYSTLGFNDAAKLDKDNMWATSYAIKKLTPKVEEMVIALVKKAVS